jgi:signal transduction histidine kinase
VADQAPAALAEGIRLHAVSSSQSVKADPTLLGRALSNLVANAIRHSQGRRALIGVRRDSEAVTLWVIDDGRGVGARADTRLFEDFAHGAAVTAGSREGFGLGLASARRSLALMGGAAGLERPWRGGSAFYLRLPREGLP